VPVSLEGVFGTVSTPRATSAACPAFERLKLVFLSVQEMRFAADKAHAFAATLSVDTFGLLAPRRFAASGFFNKLDPDLIAVHPGECATAVSQAARRKQQKKFLK
jgi:hypothetical protein